MTTRRNSAGRKATLSVAIGSLFLLSSQGTTEAGEVADALRALGKSDIVTRTVTLSDLGITEPLSFSANRVNREIFIPVPAGVPLIEPSLFFFCEGGDRASAALAGATAGAISRSAKA